LCRKKKREKGGIQGSRHKGLMMGGKGKKGRDRKIVAGLETKTFRAGKGTGGGGRERGLHGSEVEIN